MFVKQWEAVIYEGKVFDKMATLSFEMKDILMVPFAAGEYFEITRGNDIRRFVLDDVRMMMKWVLAIRLRMRWDQITGSNNRLIGISHR